MFEARKISYLKKVVVCQTRLSTKDPFQYLIQNKFNVLVQNYIALCVFLSLQISPNNLWREMYNSNIECRIAFIIRCQWSVSCKCRVQIVCEIQTRSLTGISKASIRWSERRSVLFSVQNLVKNFLASIFMCNLRANNISLFLSENKSEKILLFYCKNNCYS